MTLVLVMLYRKFSHWVFHNYFRILCALQSDLLVDDKSHFRIFFVNLILLLPTKTIPKKCVKLQSFVNCGRTKATMVTISYESSLAMTMCNTKPKEHYNRLPNTTKWYDGTEKQIMAKNTFQRWNVKKDFFWMWKKRNWNAFKASKGNLIQLNCKKRAYN